MKKLGNKGGLVSFVVALSVLFSTMLVYVAMYDVVHELLPDIAEGLGLDPTEGTLAILVTIFDIFPILMIGGVFLWAYMEQARKEPGSGYYP